MEAKTFSIFVTGLVQGVGFRPFVYRIAHRTGVSGWVMNTGGGVGIMVSGTEEELNYFLEALRNEPPEASHVIDISITPQPYTHFSDFEIRRSSEQSTAITEISPDIAVCNECLEEMRGTGFRKDYPFVNCTACGPRFTIIQNLPYDRERTTMKEFAMCEDCSGEYHDVHDRRFHAQPIACPQCGPLLSLFIARKEMQGGIHDILRKINTVFSSGGVAAIKGLGGFHLACDAFNASAIQKLRAVKRRDGKPLAVMFRDIETVRRLLNPAEEEIMALRSWQRPIVLISVTENPFPASLSSGLPSVGVMLPYTPFHHMLFDAIQTDVLVMTSGNFSNEPIIISNEDALEKFSGITDAVLVHNRPIFNRTDDSVVRIISGKERLIRRSRGYVPAALHTQLNTDGIIAMGGDLVNCFAVGRDQRVILSQYIGDLESAETHHFFEETLERFLELFRVNPVLVAGDLHPGYFSSAFGKKFRNVPFTGIQHHHAHAAACMAEHGLDEKVIAVIFDGTGWGPDNTLWGSEFLVCDLAEYRRIAHFENVPLPGGDIGAEEPWRMAVSYLDHYFGNDMLKSEIPLTERIAAEKVKTVLQMIDRGINTPMTCGAGRLFDAVSSILGLNDVATFPAEGPMRLEAAAMPGVSESYEWSFNGTISFKPAFTGIMEDMHMGKEVGYIASKFHNTLVNVIFDMVKRISDAEGIQRVVLSGGVFQNRYLLARTEEILAQNHFEVFSPAVFPANDGGIALGQLVIAAKRRGL